MKKMTEKTKHIFKCTIIAILLILLVYMVITLTGKFTNKSVAVKTVNPVEVEQEEVKDIEELNVIEEDLEEKAKEEKANNNSSPKNNTNSQNQKKKVNSDKPYYIKVNYGANVVTVYGKDENGDYTIPVKAMVCSTGRATPTSGTYTIKGRWRWLKMLGGVYAQYTTQVVGNILFHSVPYLKKGDPSSLEYWEYDKLGTRASAGCIRLTTQDAIWIYNNIASGTLVEFYSSSDPGPLGKPSAPKISWNEECRGWDPTDPDPNNPWRNYEQQNAEQEQIENKQEENVVVEDNSNNNLNDNNLDNSNNDNKVDNTNKDDNNIDNNENEINKDENTDDNINNEMNKDDNTVEDNNKEDEKKEDSGNENNGDKEYSDDVKDNNLEVNNLDNNS